MRDELDLKEFDDHPPSHGKIEITGSNLNFFVEEQTQKLMDLFQHLEIIEIIGAVKEGLT